MISQITYAIVGKSSIVDDEATSPTAEFVDGNRSTITEPDFWVLGKDGRLVEIWASIESVIPVSSSGN